MQALVRTSCFSAIACQHWVKHCLPLFWLCTLNDSSSRVRRWSSPYLVLLPRLYPCSQWYCPMALKAFKSENVGRSFSLLLESTGKRERVFSFIGRILTTEQLMLLTHILPSFVLHLLFRSFPVSLTLLECFTQTEALTEEHLKDVC